MNLLDLFQKNKNAIVSTGIIIVALIISIKIYQSQEIQISVLNRQKQSESDNNEVFKKINTLDGKLNAYKRSLKIRGSGEVMNLISEIAKDSGLKVDSIRPGSEIMGEDYVKLPASVVIIASNYNQIGRFMSKLENHSSLFTVDSFKVGFNGEKKGLMLNLAVSATRVVD